MRSRTGIVTDEGDAVEGNATGRRFILRYYNVWNVEQCELPSRVWANLVPPKRPQWDPIQRAEEIVAGMPNAPRIVHGGEQACYSKLLDTVNMPNRDRFKVPAECYSTIYHELSHYADFRIMPRILC
jgi:antirestriction protein ArdC